MPYGSAVPTGHHVETLTLGMAADDFQGGPLGQPYDVWINAHHHTLLSNIFSGAAQTGPRVQFFTIGIDPTILHFTHILTLTIDQGGTGGDGWAADFTTIGVTTAPDPAAIGLSSPVNDTIITGGTGTLGTTVTNTAGPGHANLDYNLAANVTVGSANLGAVNPGSGSLAPSASAPNTVSASSTNVGDNTIRFTATDPDASNSPQHINTTLTVLDHSHASLNNTVLQASRAIDFGRVLRNAVLPGQLFGVSNLAIGHAASDTAGLDLDSFTPNDANPLTTTLSTFTNLAAGTTSNYAASLATGNYGTFAKTVNIGLSDQNLPGAGGPNSQTLTLNLQAVVGNAIADSSNSPDTFGLPLTAPVMWLRPYAGLESRVITVGITPGGGGSPAVGTTGTLLAGSNTSGVDTGVSMAWRTRTTGETIVCSDVVNLARMVNNGEEHGQTDVFVLQMDYDEALLRGDEELLAAGGNIFLGWRDPSNGTWTNAIRGNFGVNVGVGNQGAWKGTTDLGAWGVDIDRNVVWAVLDHNSQLAVLPEPATVSLMALGLMVLAGRTKRGRHSTFNGGS